jgi:uncharacterized glyoxalase superfamily protein PhnB
MPGAITPMIHVPDVRATADWYRDLGFVLTGFNKVGESWDWARLTFGGGAVMFSIGGKPSDAHRREVDLYLPLDEGLDALFETLKDRVEVFEAPHDTEYGMREFIIRDLNRFWVSFGQPIVA